MEQQSLFKGRDKRKKGWFWIDNDYLNGYAKIFGAVGTAIYISLCRHADNDTQKCFPAQETIAEELGISGRTVRKYLAIFETYKIISIQKERDICTQKWSNNVYTLLDKECWKKPEEIVSDGRAIGNKRHEPSETDDTSHRKQFPTNKTHINKTHMKDATQKALRENPLLEETNVNKLIELFAGVNPTYERLFANKTEREAIRRLVKKFGEDWLIKLLKSLPSIISQPYAPRITTPYQLEKKLGELKSFIAQEGLKKRSKGKRVRVLDTSR